MRLAVIGAGAIVREFLPDLLRVPGLEVVSVQGRPHSAERVRALCAEYGLPAVFSFEETLAHRPDAVYVAAPNAAHCAIALQALESGLHAIVEKPMTVTFAQAQALAAAAKAHGVTVWEAVTTPYLGTYQKLRRWLPRIGTVKLVQCNFSQYSSRYDAFLRGETPPVFDPAQGGGALLDLNVYNLHFVLGLFGAPQSAQYTPVLERGIDTAGVLTLRYPGFAAALSAAKSCPGPALFAVEGTLGTLQCRYAPNLVGAVTLTLRDGTAETFDDGSAAHRALAEFTAITAAIESGDTALYEQRLDQSLTAARILTEVRTAAGLQPAAGDAPIS